MPQYPLGMGQRAASGSGNSSTVLAKRLDEHGDVAYDAVAKQGRHGKVTYSKFTDLIEAPTPDADAEAYARPDADEIARGVAETRAALEGRIKTKIQAAMPVQSRAIAAQTKAASSSQFIRYTPGAHAASGAQSSGARQRVIRMVTAQVDPLEPPKFKHSKAPGGPPSPPAPVMHSPPRKVTVEDQKAWKIPPCISNWKNSRGYTIALDKRVAADGRGLQQATINDKFAQVSEALLIAEQKAREEVERRAQFERQALVQQKGEQESALREIAKQAREIKSGGGGGGAAEEGGAARRAAAAAHARAGDDLSDSDDDSDSDSDSDDSLDAAARVGRGGAPSEAGEAEDRARMEREKLRLDRKRDRERDMRLEEKGKRTRTSREHSRDVSERVALGMPTAKTSETQYDQRLFNQSAGMDSGFGADDAYGVYSKPLFNKQAESIYRPTASRGSEYGTADEQYANLSRTDRFKPAKDFRGVDRSQPTGVRSQPVQFERSAPAAPAAAAAAPRTQGNDTDPFGLDELTTTRSRRDTGKFKQPGVMQAAAGGSRAGGGDGKGRMDFVKAKE